MCSFGEMTERFKVVALKTTRCKKPPGFESLSLRHVCNWNVNRAGVPAPVGNRLALIRGEVQVLRIPPLAKPERRWERAAYTECSMKIPVCAAGSADKLATCEGGLGIMSVLRCRACSGRSTCGWPSPAFGHLADWQKHPAATRI